MRRDFLKKRLHNEKIFIKIMLTPKQKNAIENLLILAQYAKDGSLYSKEDEKIINKSISIAEALIGKKIQEEEEPPTNVILEEIKNRLKT